MTRSFGDRGTFRALRAHGTRVRRGHLSVVYLADEPGRPCRVAYAMTKQLGSAVERNRLRRRLRHLVEDEVGAGNVPAGALLISAGPSAKDLDPPALRSQVRGLFQGLRQRIEIGAP